MNKEKNQSLKGRGKRKVHRQCFKQGPTKFHPSSSAWVLFSLLLKKVVFPFHFWVVISWNIKIWVDHFFSSLLRMSFSIFLQYKITFILSVHFWLNENGKVNPVPVTSFCLEVDVFQQIHSTTNEKTNPIWVLGWQNRN